MFQFIQYANLQASKILCKANYPVCNIYCKAKGKNLKQSRSCIHASNYHFGCHPFHCLMTGFMKKSLNKLKGRLQKRPF